MQLVVVGVRMPDPENVVLVRFEPREGHGLERVHEFFFLARRYFIPRCAGKHTGCKLPNPVLRIDQLSGCLRIAAKDFRRIFIAPGIVRTDEIIDRAASRPFAMGKDLHVHQDPLRNSCRMASRRMMT